MNLWQGLAAAGVGMLKGRQDRREYERRTKLEDAEIADKKAREKKADAYNKIKITDDAIIKLASDGNVSAARELLMQRNLLAKDADVPELPEDITNTSNRQQYEDWAAARTRFGGDESGYEAARGMFADLHGDAAADKWFPKVLAAEAGDKQIQPSVGMGSFLPRAKSKQGLLPQSELQGAPAAPSAVAPVASQGAVAQAPVTNFNPFLEEILSSLRQPAPTPPAGGAAATGTSPAAFAPPAPLPTLAAPSPITPQVGVAGGQSSMLFAPRPATMAQRDPAIEAAARAAMSAWQAQTPEERALAEKSRLDSKQFRADLLRTGPGQGYNTSVMDALMASYNGDALTPEQKAAIDEYAGLATDYKSALTGLHRSRTENTEMRTLYIPEDYRLKEEELKQKAQSLTDANKRAEAELALRKHQYSIANMLKQKSLDLQRDNRTLAHAEWAESEARYYDALAAGNAGWTDPETGKVVGATIDPTTGNPYSDTFAGRASSLRGGGAAPNAKPATKPAGKETAKDFCLRIYANAPKGLKKEMERSTLDFPDLANWLRKQGCK